MRFVAELRVKQPWFIPAGLIFAAAARAIFFFFFHPAGLVRSPRQYGSTFTQALLPVSSDVGVGGGEC